MVRTIIGGGDIQPLLAVEKKIELFALSGGGEAKILDVDPRICANEPPGEIFTT